MAKIRRPAPVRPTVAPGVPTTSYSGPSKSLQNMAAQIGRDSALAAFYKGMVEQQYDYDQDYREDYYTERRDNRRHTQAVDLMDHREYLKGEKGSGLGNQSGSSKTLSAHSKAKADAAAAKLAGESNPLSEMFGGEDTALGGIFGAIEETASNPRTDFSTVGAKTSKKAEEAATKKAKQDEAEADWWHGIKDAVVGVGDAVVPEFVEDAAKTAGGGIAGAAKAAGNTAVGGVAKDVGGALWEGLSRPGHATAGAFKAFYDLDDDSGSFSNGAMLLNPVTAGMAWTGQNPLESLDDLDWEGIKSIGSGFLGGLTGKDHTTFSDVIRSNAARDTDHNIFDSLTYQVVGGITGDIVLDPLNLVGVGLIKNVASAPVKGAQAIKRAKQATATREIADEAAAVGVRKMGPLRPGEEELLTSDQIVGMLTGKYTRKSQAIKDSERIRTNAEFIAGQVAGKSPDSQLLGRMKSKKLQLITDTADYTKAQIEAVKQSDAVETLVESVVAGVAKRESEGSLPVGTAAALEVKIHDSRINASLRKAQARITFKKDSTGKVDKGDAKEKRRRLFEDQMGDDYKNHPSLSDADRKEIFDKTWDLSALTNHPDPSIRQIAQAARQVIQGNKNRGSVAVKNANKQIDRLRPLVFRQLVDAKIKKNSGISNYTDPDRAAVLERIVSRAEKELANQGIVPRKFDDKKDIEHEAISDLEGRSTGTMEDTVHTRESEMADHVEGFAEPNLMDEDVAFESDVRFNSPQAQLQATYTAAERELRSLDSDYGDLDTSPLAVPDELVGEDGKVNKDILRRVFDISGDDALEIAPKGNIQSESVRDWAEAFARRVNTMAQAQFKRLQGDATRAAREEAERNVTVRVTIDDVRKKAQGNSSEAKTAQLAMKMFAPTKSTEGLKGSDWADKHFAPMVTVDEVPIHRNKRAALSEHVTKGKGSDTANSERMKRYLVSPNTLTYPQKKWVVEQLAAHDIGVTDTLKGVRDYLERNRDVLFNSFTPEQFAFKRMFENEHGMSLSDAMNVRARVLGNYIETPAKKWTKAFPYGISKGEFVRVITGAKSDEIIDLVTDGFPGYVVTGRAEGVASVPFSMSKGGTNKLPGWKHVFATENPFLIERALKSSGLPVGSTLEEVRKAWLKDFKDYVKNTDPEEVRVHLGKTWTDSLKNKKSGNTRRAKEFQKENEPNYESDLDYDDLRKKSRDYAVNEVISQVNRGKAVEKDSGYLNLGKTSTVADETRAVKAAAKEDHDARVDKTKNDLALAKTAGNKDDVKALENKLEDLRKEWKATADDIDAKAKEAVESSKVLEKRIREQAILNIADAQIEAGSKALSLNVAGKALQVPGTRQMFDMAEKAGSLPVIKQFSQTFSDAFASQRGKLPEDMQLIANRGLSNTSEVISLHVREIKQGIGTVPLRERRSAFRGYLTGSGAASEETLTKLGAEFDKLLPYFKGEIPVAGGKLTASDINSYLPEKFKFHGKGLNAVEFKTGKDIARHLNDATGNNNIDPIEAIWATRIAIEQALARKGMLHALGETFGIKRGYNIQFKDGSIRKGTELNPAAETIEGLGKLGWESPVKDFKGQYYFPPESAKDISRLMTMFEPKNAGRVGQFIDEVTGMWKTSVTIYNVPGYYTRNAVGEIMSAWLGGVNDQRVYKKAHDVIRFMKHEGDKVEALKDHMPALAHMLKGETNSELGRKIAITRKNGEQISAERTLVLYRDQGLSSGFINTEYSHHYSKTKERLRNVPGVKQAGQFNEGLRAANERFEDFFRMGHFIDAMNKAPVGMSQQAAAEFAAREVRKYHFDYTDFTHVEKKYMLRAFPFYKWTRKALPLMAQMMFVKPGKMMAYPKTMSGISEGLVGTEDLDPDEDQGFMPNYQNIAPSWVTDGMAYQVGGPTDEYESGTTNYLRIATPQMDSINFLSDPIDSAYKLLNPLAKVPFEQAEGETKGSMSFPIEGTEDRLAHLARTIPQGAPIANTAQGKMGRDEWVRLLTGMGYYDVSDATRYMQKGREE